MKSSSNTMRLVGFSLGTILVVTIALLVSRIISVPGNPEVGQRQAAASLTNQVLDSLAVIAVRQCMSLSPMNFLTIDKWLWDKGGFRTVGVIDVTFKNSGVRTARNIVLNVSWPNESGSMYFNAHTNIPIVVPPGTTRTASDVNLKYIIEETKGTKVEIVTADFE